MSEFAETLQRKLKSAGKLKSVVRTMKALAASSIVQYERAVASLAEYHRAVELGLVACVKQSDPARADNAEAAARRGCCGHCVWFRSRIGGSI